MKNALLLAAWCVSAVASAANESVTVPRITGPVPWSSLAINNKTGTFRIAIVTDRTGGHREGVFEDAVTKLSWLQPEFVMSVGDLIEGYTDDDAVINAQWDEFQGFIKRLPMPFFYVPGNHDFATAAQGRIWKQRFGPDYYHFTYQNVLFLCLNTEDGNKPGIQDAQAEYARKVLADHPNVRWTLVFMHRPLWNTKEAAGWLRIEEALKGRRYNVFAGHEHSYLKEVRQDRRYITLATTGGATKLRGTAFGEFDHVMWLTMKDEGPQLANLLLEGIWPDDVFTPERLKRVEAIDRAAPVQSNAVLVDQSAVSGFPVKLRVTNDADLPMEAVVEFGADGPFTLRDRRRAVTVPPNSVETLEFSFAAARPVPPTKMKPIPYDWAVKYTGDAAPKLTAKGSAQVVPARPTALPRATGPIVVDGSLADWTALPLRHDPELTWPGVGNGKTYRGAEDAAFRFAVCHDAAFVYVGVDVTDDAIVTDHPDQWPWDQDGIFIVLDARRTEEWSVKTPPDHPHLFSFLSPGKTAAETITWGRDKFPAGMQVACVRTPGGYAAELAMPVALLDKIQGRAWQALRLNVNLYDFDPESGGHGKRGGQGTYLNWIKAWDSGGGSPGTGMLIKK